MRSGGFLFVHANNMLTGWKRAQRRLSRLFVHLSSVLWLKPPHAGMINGNLLILKSNSSGGFTRIVPYNSGAEMLWTLTTRVSIALWGHCPCFLPKTRREGAYSGMTDNACFVPFQWWNRSCGFNRRARLFETNHFSVQSHGCRLQTGI